MGNRLLMRREDQGRLAERVLGLFLRLLILCGITSKRRRRPLSLSIRTGVGFLEFANPAQTLRRLRRSFQRLGLCEMGRFRPFNVDAFTAPDSEAPLGDGFT